ncbi:MAG: hypothetical protein QM817_10400 [Archangium sp.]
MSFISGSPESDPTCVLVRARLGAIEAELQRRDREAGAQLQRQSLAIDSEALQVAKASDIKAAQANDLAALSNRLSARSNMLSWAALAAALVSILISLVKG